MNGNKTQKKIWNELKKITKGKTKTYGEIGKKLKISPRYIGRVCGENKHILVIPCHRVVRTNGSLGGFSARGGVNLKRKLLIFENRKFK
jgi:methylated-DNA-[protein]-cysteine S-methyltransferase